MSATLPVLALSLLLAAPSAQNPMGGPSTGPGSRPMGALSIHGLSRDLLESDRSERIFAIRELNRVARSNLRQAEGKVGREQTDEALSTLAGLDDLAAPACIQALRFPELVSGCATLLGRLETQAARGPLEQALLTETRRRPRRAIEEAIEKIRSSSLSTLEEHQ
jgi:hypothetical protein